MSECKKTCRNCVGRIESILSKDRCDMTNKPIEDYYSTCDNWEPILELKSTMYENELKAWRKERDELQAQVAVLRGALERARKGFVNLIDLNLLPSEEYEKDANKIAQCCFEALSDTPSEAAERVQKLVAALEEVRSLADNDCDGNLSVSILQVSESAIAEWKKP